MRYIVSLHGWAGIFYLLGMLMLSPVAMADDDPAANDSCISKVAIIDRIANVAVSLGTNEIVSEGFSLENAATPTAERAPDTECNSHSNTIRFCFNPFVITNRAQPKDGNVGDETRCWSDTYYTMTVGQGTKYINGTRFQAAYIADKICMEFMAFTGAWVTLGCKYRATPPTNPVQTECYVGASCANNALRHSKSFLPITGPIAQCITETLAGIFQDTNNCLMNSAGGAERNLNDTQTTRTNLFIIFQNSLRKAIAAALTLYVIFFSIKVILGQELPSKSEIFIFILKIALVVHFALGSGLGDEIFPLFKNVATGLASIVFRAGGARGLCSFDELTYVDPTMALWDALDCRIAYYLGITDPARTMVPFLLSLAIILLPLFFFHIFFILFLIAFAIFFISIAMYVVHNYILAMISMTIILYLGPLFIPMVLFKQTKGYFDAWVKLLISFALQPMVLFAFLALILTIFDNFIYPGCAFGSKDITLPWAPGKSFPFFFIDLSNLSPADKQICENSFAYQMDMLSKTKPDQVIDMIFMTFTILDPDMINRLFSSMVKLVLFGFIASHFLEVLSGFAAEITGGQTMQSISTSPNNASNYLKEKFKALAPKGKGAKEEKDDDSKEDSKDDGGDGENEGDADGNGD